MAKLVLQYCSQEKARESFSVYEREGPESTPLLLALGRRYITNITTFFYPLRGESEEASATVRQT